MSESSADAEQTSGIQPPNADDSQKFWEFADLGFDTTKKLWFIQFFNAMNENVGTHLAKSVDIMGGRAAEYEWKDAKGGAFWHIRERFYGTEIETFAIDPKNSKIKLVFKNEDAGEEKIPSDFAYLLYAYHLGSKDGKKAPMGFVDFFDADGKSLGRANNRWIIIEGVSRKTFGEYPGIRMRVERKDIGKMVVTSTAFIIERATSR